MSNKKIFLIRHGRTDANEARIYCGISDLPLSENGVKDLEKMREYYQNLVSDKAKCFTTGMKRTNQTFEILFEKNGKLPEYNVVAGFKEINFGIFELKSYNDLKDDSQYITWISGNYESNIPPEGESGDQMSERILKTFEDFLRTTDEESVVVCHGGTAYYIMRHLFPEENKTLFEWEPKNGCGYLIELNDGKWSYEPIGIE